MAEEKTVNTPEEKPNKADVPPAESAIGAAEENKQSNAAAEKPAEADVKKAEAKETEKPAEAKETEKPALEKPEAPVTLIASEGEPKAKKKSPLPDRDKIVKMIPRAILLITIVFMVVYLISTVIFSDEFFTDSAKRNSLLHFDEDMQIANSTAEQHYDNLYDIAHRLEYAPSKEDVDSVLLEYIGSEKFGDLRYYSGGKSYSPTGAIVEETNELIIKLSSGKVEGCTDVFFDATTEYDCIAFFVPIRGSAYVDGILSVVPARNVISISEIVDEKTNCVAIIDKSGKVLASMSAEGFERSVGNNYFNFISSIADNTESVTIVRDTIAQGKKNAAAISALGEKYTVAAAPLSSFDDNLTFVALYISEGLIADEATYIRHIVTLLIITIISLAVSLVYAFLFNKKAKEAISTANLTDATIECANAEQFRRRSIDLMHERGAKDRRYAVVAFAIKQFVYLGERIGEAETTKVLKSIAKTVSNFCDATETYGYAGEGKFLCLYNFTSERALRDKIYLIGTLANANESLSDNKIKLKFDVGVYYAFEGQKRSVKEMIDCAFAASELQRPDSRLPYSLYTSAISEQITREAKIEAEMEIALKNGDFRLFLQPKYNVKNDSIDSAEALVRWFDIKTGDYRFPAQFISLFENNGFITKLDHFIYLEVLKFLHSAIERGDKVVPIAVNVSRVTASDPEFISFYVGNKHKYEIPDNLITVEFTESFAMEDYDKIFYMVERLHKSGIRCSIDDFGSGYSSFNILKRVPMDELKLDRFFMVDGINRTRDDKLIKMVIDLAKTMNMTVVQEGVETKEMFNRIVNMGIDVVQGYYYAKAISLEEYKIFLKSNTSIKYKSIVK